MSKYEDPVTRRAREFYEQQRREQEEFERINETARQRLADNPEAIGMAHIGHSGALCAGTAEPGRGGFERDGYVPQAMDPQDVAMQTQVRILFNQANPDRR